MSRKIRRDDPISRQWLGEDMVPVFARAGESMQKKKCRSAALIAMEQCHAAIVNASRFKKQSGLFA